MALAVVLSVIGLAIVLFGEHGGGPYKALAIVFLLPVVITDLALGGVEKWCKCDLEIRWLVEWLAFPFLQFGYAWALTSLWQRLHGNRSDSAE